jgi:hypothetical protein
MVDIIFYFEIFILLRKRERMLETCNMLSFLIKINSYIVVNLHLNIYVLVSVFCVLYEFRT